MAAAPSGPVRGFCTSLAMMISTPVRSVSLVVSIDGDPAQVSPLLMMIGFPVSSRNWRRGLPACRLRRRCWPNRPAPARSVWGLRSTAATMMAWPRPWLVASSGASLPLGRVCRPQVLATSMTAVVPSNAATVGCSWPVAPATVIRMRRNPAAMAACDAAVAAVGEGQSGADDPAFGESRAEVVDHLGGGEAALELVRCQENLHDLVFSSSTVDAGDGQVGEGTLAALVWAASG